MQLLVELLGGDPLRPDQLRRIAELTQVCFDDEASLIWWQRAAVAGDDDAQDYLAALLGDGWGD